VTITPAPLTQTAISNASPTAIIITSTLSPQADRAPTCDSLSVPVHRKEVGAAEIAAIVFGLLTLMLLVGMCFLARRCYGMRRVGGKGGRDGDGGARDVDVGVGVDNEAGHPVKKKLGRRIMDRVVKICKRKEAWER